MGTRHLTMVVLDGQTRVAQYGQWDGYPEGQGNTVLEFLSSMDRPLFEQKVRASRFATDEEQEAALKEIGVDVGAKGCWLTEEQSEKFNAKFPAFSRDHGAAVLQLICDSPAGVVLRDSSQFGLESLFCEYAYVIDLDKNVLEYYRGFNTDPAADIGRFAALKPENYADEESHDKKRTYQPVRLVKVYPLDALPTVRQLIDDGTTEEERKEREEEEKKAAKAVKVSDAVPAECETTPAPNQ